MKTQRIIRSLCTIISIFCAAPGLIIGIFICYESFGTQYASIGLMADILLLVLVACIGDDMDDKISKYDNDLAKKKKLDNMIDYEFPWINNNKKP